MNLLIDESPLVLLPSLAQRIGLDEAIVVQQVHYLVNANANVENSRAYQDNCYWVFNSIEQWQKKYFKWWSVPTVKRVFQGLTECDLLITKTFSGGKNHNRLWYRVNHSLIEIISVTPLADFPSNRNDRIKMIRSKWSDQNDPIKTEVSDHFDPVVSDQNDPIKTEVSDHFDPSTIYKRSILNKNSLEEEPTPPAKKVETNEEEVAQLEISSFVKQPTHSSIANNPSSGSKVPLPPLKQVNTNAYSNAADVYELIELWLGDSEYMSDAIVPIAVREKIKWSNWQLPWRSPFHSVYQSFSPAIVQKLAAELAKKSGGSANDKISHAIATINAWERTKGGWSNLLSLCDRPSKESEPEDTCAIDFDLWEDLRHATIFDRDYLRSSSIKEFYEKCSWYKSWHKYAVANYPEWTWNAIK